ncbi:glycosyl hydrolase catalytic core-domain-containing protein [Auriculariales sp. MPI-PUGE-AT-0066]|nr:glycosyl hydrolase catalytic core-domain-containing protein [Auriculariales sp. MPI-PUGE-AT-0066]
MVQLSITFVALLGAIAARAAPSTTVFGPRAPSAVNGDLLDLDAAFSQASGSALAASEHTWGHSFNATEWGLEERDFLDLDAADDEFDEEDELETREWIEEEEEDHDLESRAAKPKKVGLAFDYASPINLGAWKSSRVRAVYNWDIWKPKGIPKGIPYWPMLHRAELTKNWLATCKKGYAGVALGFNEPDNGGQANMSPKQAAALWKKYMIPLRKRGYSLISPAVTSAPTGIKWLREFKKECPSCWNSFGGLALHYYGKDANAFKSYMARMHKEFPNKAIHITETACEDFSANKCSDKQAASYLEAVTAWAMKTSYVHSIFYFGMWPKNKMPGSVGASNSLMNGDGKPSTLGRKFLNH